MKQSLIILVAVFTAGIAVGQKMQETEVPAAVKQTFVKSFPSAKDVKWSKEDGKEIEAEFKHDGKKISASFSLTGEWIETETEISKKDLPLVVQQSIAKELAGYDAHDFKKIETAAKVITYKGKAKKDDVKYKVEFAADGKMLKKEKKDKKEKEDKD